MEFRHHALRELSSRLHPIDRDLYSFDVALNGFAERLAHLSVNVFATFGLPVLLGSLSTFRVGHGFS